LYVVLFHAGVGFTATDLPLWARGARHLLTFGHDAVAVFIVLSGYCLMLPVVRADGQLVGGFGRYIARRAWRILPPYYATLLGSLLLLWAAPLLQTRTGTIWDDTSPAFTAGPIVTHLLLLHNLVPDWASRINGPLWSVATEWQIYFFFPILLLPIWRRAGLLTAVVAGFVVGCCPLWLAPLAASRWIPWYLGLFALGMCAAAIGSSERPLERRMLRSVPWKLALFTLALCCLFGTTVLIKFWFRFLPLSDSLVGLTTAVALTRFSKYLVEGGSQPRPWLLRWLEARPLVAVGHFSYSLYLTHLPTVAGCYFMLRPLALHPAAQFLTMVVISVPASLVVALAFYWAVERHFTGRPPAFTKRR
jgi:peptidoglycan/LPS O-acetylase OafA/YrhL